MTRRAQGRSDKALGSESCAAPMPAALLEACSRPVQKVLSTQAGSVADSIVLINQLGQWADPQQLLSQASRRPAIVFSSLAA